MKIKVIGLCLLTTIGTMQAKQFAIVSCSYNNKAYYQWSLDSVFNQDYDDWHLYYVDDYSPDGTGNLVEAYVKEKGFEKKVTLYKNQERHKALENLYMVISKLNPTDIVVILDGDDRFSYDGVLSFLKDTYTDENVWLTYGQFQEYPSMRKGFCKPYHRRVSDLNSFRMIKDAPSHLRTFYAALFQKIKIEDLQFEGGFFPMTYDLAMMFPMIEMARNGHFKFIPKILYDYNTSNPINDHKVSQQLQRKCDQVIRHREKYSALETLFSSLPK